MKIADWSAILWAKNVLNVLGLITLQGMKSIPTDKNTKTQTTRTGIKCNLNWLFCLIFTKEIAVGIQKMGES